mgnify:CR=1 FL=1
MNLRLADLEPAQRDRLLGSRIVPRPTARVASRSPGFPVNAAPISFFNLFGDDPPIVALGQGDGSRPDAAIKDIQRNALASGEAVIGDPSRRRAAARRPGRERLAASRRGQ